MCAAQPPTSCTSAPLTAQAATNGPFDAAFCYPLLERAILLFVVYTYLVRAIYRDRHRFASDLSWLFGSGADGIRPYNDAYFCGVSVPRADVNSSRCISHNF